MSAPSATTCLTIEAQIAEMQEKLRIDQALVQSLMAQRQRMLALIASNQKVDEIFDSIDPMMAAMQTQYARDLSVGINDSFKLAYEVVPGVGGFAGLDFTSTSTFEFMTGTLGSWDLTKIFAVGDTITVAGCTNAANNGQKNVQAVTTSQVTTVETTNVVAEEASASFIHTHRTNT